jgi:hypothetical protein
MHQNVKFICDHLWTFALTLFWLPMRGNNNKFSQFITYLQVVPTETEKKDHI